MDCWSRNVNTTHSRESLFLFIYLFRVLFCRVRGDILTRGQQYCRALSSGDGGGGDGGSSGCGMVCRRWIESGGVVVHLASCRPQPVRRVRPLTVFIPRILDVQPAPLRSLRFCEERRQRPIEINYFVGRPLLIASCRYDRNRAVTASNFTLCSRWYYSGVSFLFCFSFLAITVLACLLIQTVSGSNVLDRRHLRLRNWHW